MMCLLTRRLWCRYISPKFPKLLITSYNFVQEYCSQESIVRAAETNLNMIRQVTTPVKSETKGTGSVPAGSAMIPARNAMIPAGSAMIPARNAMIPAGRAMIPARNAMIPARNAKIPVTTVAGRAAAGPAGPSYRRVLSAKATVKPFNSTATWLMHWLNKLFQWSLSGRLRCAFYGNTPAEVAG